MTDSTITLSGTQSIARWWALAWFRMLVRQHWAILLIALTFLALGVLYSVKTPLFETPDEPWHYAYVKRLADGGGLPPLLVSEDEWTQGEAHQPPLYYALGALLTRGIETGPVETLYERNPFAALGLPDSSGNKNVVMHGENEGFPYTGVALAVHVLRWFSLVCSLATVVLTYRIVLEVVPRRKAVALGAATLVAFNPQFLFISAGANNDALVTCLATAVLYLALRVTNGHARDYRTPLLLGLLVGLAGLTKQSGLLTALLVPLAYLGLAHRRNFLRPWEDLARPMLITAGVALLVAGWWYGRNAFLYHDLTGMKAMTAAFSIREVPLPLLDVLRLFVEALISYWGVFGWMNVLADEIFYTLVRVLTILGTIGLILLAARIYWWRRTLRQYRWRAAILLACWALIVFVSLVRWVQMITGPQGRLLFPAIAALSFFLFVGLAAWVPNRFAPWAAGGLVVLLLAASLAAPLRYIAPAYALPQRMPLEETPEVRGLDVGFGDGLFLLGYTLEQESVTAGQTLHLHLYWLARKQMSEDYVFYVHVLGQDGQRIGGVDTYPGKGNYPTSRWIPGEVICDEYSIRIDPEAVAPVAATVRVGVYTRPNLYELPVTDAQGRALGNGPAIARVRVGPLKLPSYQPRQALQINLSNMLLLTGYDVFLQPPTEGNKLQVTLYWRALAEMPADYTIFLHLMNSQDQRVAQLDEQPLQGNYPTHFWLPGESVRDRHDLVLPDHLPDGDYYVRIGLYRLETGERLPVAETDPPITYMTLGPIHVEGR